MVTSLFWECMTNNGFSQGINILRKLNKTISIPPIIIEQTKKIKFKNGKVLYDLIKQDLHIGNCGLISILMSLLFDDCSILFGKNEYLKGTVNSPNGEHAWLLVGDSIYDMTLFIQLKQEEEMILGYMENFEIRKKELLNCVAYQKWNNSYKRDEPLNENLEQEIMDYVLNINLENRISRR